MRTRDRASRLPPSPGDVLRRLLAECGVTQDELASAMRVSRYSVNQLINGRRAVTAEMALRLARAVSTSPEFWLNLQRSIDLDEARRRLASEITSVRTVRKQLSKKELFLDVAG